MVWPVGSPRSVMGSSVKLHSIALCALAMIALVTFALLWWGLSLVAALASAPSIEAGSPTSGGSRGGES